VSKLLLIPLGLSGRPRYKASCSGNGKAPLPPSGSDESELGELLLIPLGLGLGAGDEASCSGNGEAGLGGAEGDQDAESQENLRIM